MATAGADREPARALRPALLGGDLAAGIAVTAMIVPKNLGYAGIAGVPLQNGLYAAAAGAIIYALFCTSRQISTGPSSSLAAVAGGAVVVTGLAGDQAAAAGRGDRDRHRASCSSSLAVLRMGWISQFLSKAVITGFLAGAAVDVVIGELPKLTGTSSDGANAWSELASWIGALGDIHCDDAARRRRGAGRDPRASLRRAGGPGRAGARRRRASSPPHLFELGGHGVALVGTVPRGLPMPQLPDARRWSADHSRDRRSPRSRSC